jgi:YfiH family protein
LPEISLNPSAFLAANWPAPGNVRACTTLRSGPGVSSPPFDHFNLGINSGDDSAVVAENRRRLIEIAELPTEPFWLQQVHGTVVADSDLLLRTSGEKVPKTDEGQSGSTVIADASRTSRTNTVLAILTADCLPVLFCNTQGSEIAAAHAGWRGLAAGVLEATVRSMRSAPKELLVWFGPAAGPANYEIGAEVRDAFLAVDPAADIAFFPTRENHWRVDLSALARQRLASVGVTRVFGGGLCTIADQERFYSHRRDGRTGRMASLIWIKG